MKKWTPINQSEFTELFRKQFAELNQFERNKFEIFRGPFFKATIRRSETAGDESVFVVAQKDDGVLYFDDVEYGFNLAIMDKNKRILTPGGSQNTLKEAIIEWL